MGNIVPGSTFRAAACAVDHLREGPVEITWTLRLDELKPHSQRPRRDFCFLQHVLFRAFAEAPGCQRTATGLTPGTACLSRSSRLPTISEASADNPVTLPPGRARLLTSPS